MNVKQMTRSGKAGAAPAVTRAARILRLLADSETPLGVNAIARALDLVPSTCLHILRALVAEELVAVDRATKRYALDAGVLSLAHRLLRQDDFARQAQRPLDEMARRFAVTTIAVRLTGYRHMVVVALARAEGTFGLHVDIGSRFPALISATGRCYAAFGRQRPEKLRAAFERLTWDHAPRFEDWLAEVEATRVSGIGIDAGRYIGGITVIAAPVLDTAGLMTHGLVAVGVSERLSDDEAARIGAELKAAAAMLSASDHGLRRPQRREAGS